MQVLGIIPGIPGYAELLIVVMVGLLLFGRRLPEVGRSVGRTIVEFKKGIREVKDDVDKASSSTAASPNRLDAPSGASGGHAAADPAQEASKPASNESAASSTSAAADPPPNAS